MCARVRARESCSIDARRLILTFPRGIPIPTASTCIFPTEYHLLNPRELDKYRNLHRYRFLADFIGSKCGGTGNEKCEKGTVGEIIPVYIVRALARSSLGNKVAEPRRKLRAKWVSRLDPLNPNKLARRQIRLSAHVAPRRVHPLYIPYNLHRIVSRIGSIPTARSSSRSREMNRARSTSRIVAASADRPFRIQECRRRNRRACVRALALALARAHRQRRRERPTPRRQTHPPETPQTHLRPPPSADAALNPPVRLHSRPLGPRPPRALGIPIAAPVSQTRAHPRATSSPPPTHPRPLSASSNRGSSLLRHSSRPERSPRLPPPSANSYVPERPSSYLQNHPLHSRARRRAILFRLHLLRGG